jgi:hypothetical protein
MDALTLFGLFAVAAMLVCYALENRSPWFILAFGRSRARRPQRRAIHHALAETAVAEYPRSEFATWWKEPRALGGSCVDCARTLSHRFPMTATCLVKWRGSKMESIYRVELTAT